MAGLGHFYQFPATSPSDGYLFSQETVAGQPPTGEVRRNRPFVERGEPAEPADSVHQTALR